MCPVFGLDICSTQPTRFSVANILSNILRHPAAATSAQLSFAGIKGQLGFQMKDGTMVEAAPNTDGLIRTPATSADEADTRDTKSAMLRGWRRKCPKCGSGPLLKSYLKVNDTCSVCRQDLTHHRADDGPAYLTILIVGHLMAPLLHVTFVTWRPEPLTLFTIFAVGCVGLSLYLLPRLKGAIVGYQWARRMGGFGQEV